VLVVTAIVMAALALRKSKPPDPAVLDAVAGLLDAPVDGRTVAGRLDGVEVRFSLVDRSRDSHRDLWTHVECALPAGCPLVLYVEPHQLFDGGRIAAGELTDVTLGDLPFDARFRVEAAPAEVVRRLLGDQLRAWLLDQPDVELHTDSGGRLVLAMPGWDGVERACHAVRHAAAIAAGLPAATAAVDRAAGEQPADDPYRSVPAQVHRQQARADEVALVRTSRERRLTRVHSIGVGVAVLIALAVGFVTCAR